MEQLLTSEESAVAPVSETNRISLLMNIRSFEYS